MVLLSPSKAPPQASLLGRTPVFALWGTTRPMGPRSTQPPSPSPKCITLNSLRVCALCTRRVSHKTITAFEQYSKTALGSD